MRKAHATAVWPAHFHLVRSANACRFTPALEKKQGGKQKAATLEVSHTFEDGSVARFLVTDSPLKLPATALGGDHWSNVAAAFVQVI